MLWFARPTFFSSHLPKSPDIFSSMTRFQFLRGFRCSFTRSCRSVEGLRRWTRGLQAGVALLLVVAAVTGGILTYRHGRDAELRQFTTAINSLGAEAAHACSEAVAVKFTAAKSGAKWLANYSITTDSAVVPAFSSMSADLLRLGNASLGEWLLVVPIAERHHVEELGSSLASNAQFLGSTGFQAAAHRGFSTRDWTNGALVPEPEAPLYIILWLSTFRTPVLDELFLFDMRNVSFYIPTLLRSVTQGRIAITRSFIPPSLRWGLNQTTENSSPNGFIAAPSSEWNSTTLQILNKTNISLSSMYWLAFSWADTIKTCIKTPLSDVDVVLTSPAGEQHTFVLSGGNLESVGRGDLHRAPDLDRFAQTVLTREAMAAGTVDVYRITLFPTHRLVDSFRTSEPLDTALLISLMMVACGVVFVLYGTCVQASVSRLVGALRLSAISAATSESHATAEHEASKAKDQFVSMVSHEIRTPLNAVSGGVALLAQTPLTAEQHELLDLVDAGASHTLFIIDDILLHGSLLSGEFVVASEPFHLARAVLEPAWKMLHMSPTASQKIKQLRLTREVAPELESQRMLGDSKRLIQILINLLTNALKFTPAGGSVHLSVASKQRDGVAGVRVLVVSVTDTGIGIAAGAQERVFEPFKQADASTTREFGGIGLGLTISRRLARAMGGDLTVSSCGIGFGCTFELTLPLVEPPGGGSDADDAPPPVEPPAAPGGGDTSASLVAVGADTAGASASTAVAASAPLLGPPFSAPQPHPPPSLHPLATPLPSGSASGGGAAAAARIASSGSSAAASSLPVSILVAEDDRMAQMVIRKMLTSKGAAVTLVENGQLAVDVFEADAGKFDLVVTDLHMPVLDGLGAGRAIRAIQERLGTQVPVVALTASCSAEERERCRQVGMAGLISKPVSSETVMLLKRFLAHEE